LFQSADLESLYYTEQVNCKFISW